jgi:transcriptional regulator with XRE-family HTH domain
MTKTMNKAKFFKALIKDLIDRDFIKNNSDLASKLGIPRSSLSDILSGRISISIDKIIKISECFNVEFKVKNGVLDYNFIDDSEKLDPLFQNSINFLKHLAHDQPEKTTKFVKSLTDLLKDNNTE